MAADVRSMSKGQTTPKAFSKNINILSLYGILKPRVRGVTLEQMDEAIQKQGASSL